MDYFGPGFGMKFASERVGWGPWEQLELTGNAESQSTSDLENYNLHFSKIQV